MNRAAAERGFTLVEVMVSLLIFGMLAAAGVALLSFSVRAQGMAATRLDDVAALTRVGSAMAADLAQAVDRPSRDETGLRRPAFVGGAGSVALVRDGWSNLDGAPRAGAQKVAWRVDGTTLVRVAWPMLDGAAPIGAAPMLTDLRQLAFRYRFAGAWSDRWDGAVGVALPDALEMVATGRDGRPLRQLFLVGTGYAPQPAAQPSAAVTPSA